MKKCKNCGKEFPSNASLHQRSYCLECSPIGSKKGYKLRKLRHKRPEKKTCPICKKTFKWTKNNVCSTCRTAFLRWEKRNKALSFLGNKCSQCGIEDLEVLVFHHERRETKKFTLCEVWNSLSWEEIKKELDKCILLCANCHAKLHSPRNKKNFRMIQTYFEINRK